MNGYCSDDFQYFLIKFMNCLYFFQPCNRCHAERKTRYVLMENLINLLIENDSVYSLRRKSLIGNNTGR